ncbi:hypothetical protein I302_108864 [Kwoniella bestiolae CBS 10118]|uniref:Triacylglycerol lipase n=1 Tax=Kwoniella bestiolae CBS 10118 TaxID=1296100 RepID=A0A1B9FUB5_9TREE|nr:triacylglycerol lipase [Kwoniella bestiolae CBS 10118]OCF22354.1 triacylglycerol lipase [Kwoniella bestiolae CBS 10118]
MTALSPFRYFAVARYLVHRWVDSIPSIKGKGKAKALQHVRQTQRQRDHLLRSTSLESHSSSHAHSEIPLAGPSRLPHNHHHQHGSGTGHGGKGKRPDVKFPKLAPDPKWPPGPKEIFRLMNDERLMVGGRIKPPRETVVLCHGLYGFSTATPIPLFPSLKLHYWANVLDVLRNKIGANVVVVGVKGTGSIQERAEQMHQFLKDTLPKGTGVNFVAHSMGGLDCRYLISTIKPTSYTPLSLTTIGTPHRGSPFMDWCAANIGVGSVAAAATAVLAGGKTKSLLPYSMKSPLLSRPPLKQETKEQAESSFGSSFAAGLTSYLLSIFDSPAYSNLTTSFLRDHFNPSTPDSANVKYTSVAGRISKMSVLHPLWFPKLVLDAAAENGYAEDHSNIIHGPNGKRVYEGNDGLVSVSSAKWGEYLGAVDECHHWDLRGEGGLFPQGLGNSDEKAQKARKEQQEEEEADALLSEYENNRKSPIQNQQNQNDHSKHGLNQHLGLSIGLQTNPLQNPGEAVEEALNKFELNKSIKNEGKAGSSPSTTSRGSGGSGSSWDIAQVGQIIDWVNELLPGDEKQNKNSEISKKQLQDATLEKAEDGQQEQKRKKEKFDLGRFYGGLMIKLREDGY